MVVFRAIYSIVLCEGNAIYIQASNKQMPFGKAALSTVNGIN